MSLQNGNQSAIRGGGWSGGGGETRSVPIGIPTIC